MKLHPLKSFAAAIVATWCAGAAFALQPVELKRDIRASGPAITLGDLFVDAGAVSGRACAPAPIASQVSKLNSGFVAKCAESAGLAWTPPNGPQEQILVAGPNAIATRQLVAFTAPKLTPVSAGGDTLPDALVHRGDLVTLVYVGKGFMVTTSAKALDDAKLGGAVRVLPVQSTKVIDARVTGAGAVSTSPAL